MHEKHRRVRCELTAIFNGLFERALMNAERSGQMAERIFSLPTHAIIQAKNPAITPKTIRTIDFSYFFLEMSRSEGSASIDVILTRSRLFGK